MTSWDGIAARELKLIQPHLRDAETSINTHALLTSESIFVADVSVEMGERRQESRSTESTICPCGASGKSEEGSTVTYRADKGRIGSKLLSYIRQASSLQVPLLEDYSLFCQV